MYTQTVYGKIFERLAQSVRRLQGRLLPTLRMRYWWPTILTNVKNVSKNCDVCQCSKILPKQNRLTLNPWPVPTRPWELISIDHKKLSKKTTLGNAHILVFCDHFSGKVKYCPVPSETTFVTAQAFVRKNRGSKRHTINLGF